MPPSARPLLALPGAKLLAGGIACAALGSAPLLLYVALGPADGNPIGLGLLFITALPIGALCALVGLARLALGLLAPGR